MDREIMEIPTFPKDEGELSTKSSNSTLPTPEELTNKQVTLIILFGLITLVTIFANTFVLYIFAVGKRRLRNPTNLLLANLAVADLLVGLVIMPSLAATTILDGKWIFGDLACEAFDYFHFLLCAASMWSMVGVAIDRFIGVSRPLQYKYVITKSRTILLILIIWLTAASLTSGPLTIWPKEMSGFSTICNVNLRKEFLLFIIFFGYYIPITGTVIIYLIVYRKAIAPFMNDSVNVRQKSDDGGNGAKEKQTRLAKSIAIVTGTLFLFYCPIFAVFTIKAFDLPYFSLDLLFLTSWIRYCCSTVNPFLYGLAVPGYQQEIKERLFGISKKGRRSEESMTQSYVTGSENNQGGHKSIEEQPKVLVEPSKSAQTNKSSRFCTQCGFLMKDFIASRNARCDKCHRQILCASWFLPSSWGTPSYFICPNCPAIRFFDGVETCFCQNCSHKFAPAQSRPRDEKLASLATLTRKPPQQVKEAMQNMQIPSINLGIQREVQEERKEAVVEQRAKVIKRLRNSVMVPYLEQRRSQLLPPPAAVETGIPNQTHSASLRELEEIMAQLEQTFGIDIDPEEN